MPANYYRFITHWRVEGTVTEVADTLKKAEDLPRWWPSVYLDVRVLNPGDKDGIGKVVSLYTKGWLPYTLRWQFQVTESNYPFGFSLEASGDFEGRGIWSFEQDGLWVNVVYDWKTFARRCKSHDFRLETKVRTFSRVGREHVAQGKSSKPWDSRDVPLASPRSGRQKVQDRSVARYADLRCSSLAQPQGSRTRPGLDAVAHYVG